MFPATAILRKERHRLSLRRSFLVGAEENAYF